MRDRRTVAATLIAAAALLAPTAASANLIWPAAFVEGRLLSVPVIAAGLAVEIGVLRFGFGLGWGRAAIAAIVVNLISAAIGLVAIPLLGVAWEIFPGMLLSRLFDIHTFHPITWAATFVFALVVTTIIEVLALRWIFRLEATRPRWGLWLGANAASVASAFLSFFVTPMSATEVYDPWLFG